MDFVRAQVPVHAGWCGTYGHRLPILSDGFVDLVQGVLVYFNAEAGAGPPSDVDGGECKSIPGLPRKIDRAGLFAYVGAVMASLSGNSMTDLWTSRIATAGALRVSWRWARAPFTCLAVGLCVEVAAGCCC